MKIRFVAPAEAELVEAIAFLDRISPQLGQRFAVEARNGLERIGGFPNAWQSMAPGIRRYRLNRFPYGLVYSVSDAEIIVLAVMHLHRKPGYWRDRLGG